MALESGLPYLWSTGLAGIFYSGELYCTVADGNGDRDTLMHCI